jgi:hypothetical protein
MFNFKFPFFFKASGLLALPGVLFLSASLASAQPSVSNPLPVNEQAPLSPLMFVYSAELDDYFYSLKIDEIESAIHLHGYDDLQTASKIDILGYVESTAQTNTQLLRRMFKGFPHYSHYYTADEAEFESALANGYRFESNEG